MRISVALFFAAIVCTAQAQLISGLLGQLGQSADDRIKDLRKVIDETLQKAEEALQNSYKNAREQAKQAYERVEEAAEKVNERVKQAVNKIQDSVQKQVDQLAQKAVGEGVDVSECTGLVKTFREAARVVVTNDAYCVTKNVQKAKDILTDILNKGQESLDVITSIRSKSNDCIDNVKGIAAQVSCLVSVGAKATWALTTKVPAVAADYAQGIALISTVPVSLNLCFARSSFLDLAEQGSAIVLNVSSCISRIQEIQGKGSSAAPEVPPVSENPAPFPSVPTTTPQARTSTSKLVLPGFE